MSDTPYVSDYDWDSDGQIKRGSSGVAVVRADTDVLVKKPSWFGKETVFRPYPYLSDPRNPDSPFEPYRKIDSQGRNKFSDWIRRYVCAWNVGNPATTFLIKRNPGSVVFDPHTTPLGILYRAINNAVKKGQCHQEWPPLLMKVAGKSPTLEGPKECYVMQGMILRHDGKDYFGQFGDPLGFGKNPPVVLLCSGGAGSELVNKLMEENENYHGDPLDFEARYKSGDPVNVKNGRFIYFFEKGRNPVQGRYASQPSDGGGFGASSGGSRKTKEIGFDTLAVQEFEGLKPYFNQVGERIIRSKVRCWEDILYFPDEVQQAHMLFKCFPLSACMYAFDGVNKDWIPEDAYKKLANAHSVNVGTGYQPAPGFGTPPAQPQPRPESTPGWGSGAQPQTHGFGEPSNEPVPPNPFDGTGTPEVDTTVPAEDASDVVDATFGYKPAEAAPEAAPIAVAPKPPEKPRNKNADAAIAKLSKARQDLKS